MSISTVSDTANELSSLVLSSSQQQEQNELQDVQPAEINFHKALQTGEHAQVFLVTVRNKLCVMKVHHGRGPRLYYEDPDEEVDPHVRESTAYARLKAHGVCDRGFVPMFLGTLRKFDPSLLQPHLKEFIHDEYLPSAIFLEYISTLEPLTLENYSVQRASSLVEGMREIHKALVLHDDTYSSNVGLLTDDKDRGMWLDFDCALTFDFENISDRQQGWLDFEQGLAEDFSEAWALDHQTGKVDELRFMW